MSAARTAVLEALKANLKRLDGSYRAAFFHIPLVWTHGVYVLRHSYIRRPVQVWDPVKEVLEVVYSRVFKFNDDGTLVYAMLPGEYGACVKEFGKRSSTRVAYGTYRLEGGTLAAMVRGDRGVVTRWQCAITNSSEGGMCNRLMVASLLLCEGGDHSGTPITAVQGDELEFKPVPAYA